MPRSNLTADDVAKIKRRLWNGETCDAIALDYNASPSSIRSILHGVRWKTVPWPENDAKGREQSGALPRERVIAIMAARREARKEASAKAVRKLTKGDKK
jgi:hypothetical protein